MTLPIHNMKPVNVDVNVNTNIANQEVNAISFGGNANALGVQQLGNQSFQSADAVLSTVDVHKFFIF